MESLESIFGMFPILFDGTDEQAGEGGAIAENNRMIREEFQKRWGWHELLHNVCEYLFIPMPEGMKQSAMEVLMYATLLKEKVQITKK